VPSERPLDRLLDIIENIERIEAYTDGCDLARFTVETIRQDAVERCLLRLSEAARKLGPAAERLMPDQPWPAIRSIGNVLRHEYDSVDPAVIWRVVESDLGRLKAAVAAALDRLQGNPQG
jgi:uncharacterized protein with HEPN domain